MGKLSACVCKAVKTSGLERTSLTARKGQYYRRVLEGSRGNALSGIQWALVRSPVCLTWVPNHWCFTPRQFPSEVLSCGDYPLHALCSWNKARAFSHTSTVSPQCFWHHVKRLQILDLKPSSKDKWGLSPFHSRGS